MRRRRLVDGRLRFGHPAFPFLALKPGSFRVLGDFGHRDSFSLWSAPHILVPHREREAQQRNVLSGRSQKRIELYYLTRIAGAWSVASELDQDGSRAVRASAEEIRSGDSGRLGTIGSVATRAPLPLLAKTRRRTTRRDATGRAAEIASARPAQAAAHPAFPPSGLTQAPGGAGTYSRPRFRCMHRGAACIATSTTVQPCLVDPAH